MKAQHAFFIGSRTSKEGFTESLFLKMSLYERRGDFKNPTLQFRVRRVTVATRVSKKKPITQSRPLCRLCHPGINSSEQSLVSSSPRHVIFILIMPLLIGLLQVDYQNKNVSPLDSHPVNMWVFFGAAFTYCLGLVINEEFKNQQASYSQIMSHVILSSGALASVSLASVFFPGLVGWLCLALWTLLPIIFGRRLIKRVYQWHKHGTVKAIAHGCNRFNRFSGCLTLKKQNLPI